LSRLFSKKRKNDEKTRQTLNNKYTKPIMCQSECQALFAKYSSCVSSHRDRALELYGQARTTKIQNEIERVESNREYYEEGFEDQLDYLRFLDETPDDQSKLLVCVCPFTGLLAITDVNTPLGSFRALTDYRTKTQESIYFQIIEHFEDGKPLKTLESEFIPLFYVPVETLV